MEIKAALASALVAVLVTGCATRLENDAVKALPSAPKDHLTYFDPALLEATRTLRAAGVTVEVSDFSKTEQSWYPKHWVVAEEPSYWRLSNDQNYSEEQFVRLTVLPTFSAPQIYSIRILGDQSGIWTFKQTNGKGGYGAGEGYRSNQKQSSKGENTRFIEHLRRIGAFDQAYDCWPDPNTLMLDGTKIVFEFSQFGRYEFTRCGLRSEHFSSVLMSVFTESFGELASVD